MHVMALASRNGGAGKTTLAIHLAVAAEAAGVGPVALIDTGPQCGLAGWWNARDAVTPAWIDTRPHGLPAAVTAARKAGYGVLLIDTPSVAETIAAMIETCEISAPNNQRCTASLHHGTKGRP
jgi:chromosome partitioning protein